MTVLDLTLPPVATDAEQQRSSRGAQRGSEGQNGEEPSQLLQLLSSNSRSRSHKQQIYGYYNTFHVHAQPSLTGPPPSYSHAISVPVNSRFGSNSYQGFERLPEYSCSVALEGVMAMKRELDGLYSKAEDRRWSDVFVTLAGTQLSIYRVKSPSLLSKSRGLTKGRLIRSFTLQHAEVGVAADFKKTDPVPRSALAHLVPPSSRAKLYETDPHLFDPPREFVVRLRLETDQFLLCCDSQESMLTWVETLCSAVDISPPLEDRSEPRYRSLPRRSRRQRQIDRQIFDMEGQQAPDVARDFLEQQERIIRTLYPRLGEGAVQQQSRRMLARAHSSAETGADPDADELDPNDVRHPHSPSRETFPPLTPTSASQNTGLRRRDPPRRRLKTDAADEEDSAAILRYRRRCAPVLCYLSPRASDIIITPDGMRARVIVKDKTIQEFETLPPRYDAHGFNSRNSKPLPIIRSSHESQITTASGPSTPPTLRPTPMERSETDRSYWSLDRSPTDEADPETDPDHDLSQTSSRLSSSDEIEVAPRPLPRPRNGQNSNKREIAVKVPVSPTNTNDQQRPEDEANHNNIGVAFVC